MEKVWYYWELKLAFSDIMGFTFRIGFASIFHRRLNETNNWVGSFSGYNIGMAQNYHCIGWSSQGHIGPSSDRNKPSITRAFLLEKWQQKTRMQEAFLILSFMLLLNLCCFLSTFLEIGNLKVLYPSALTHILQDCEFHQCMITAAQAASNYLALLTIRSSFATPPVGLSITWLKKISTVNSRTSLGCLQLSVLPFHQISEWLKFPSRMRACECDASCTWNRKISSIASPWTHSESRKLRN